MRFTDSAGMRWMGIAVLCLVLAAPAARAQAPADTAASPSAPAGARVGGRVLDASTQPASGVADARIRILAPGFEDSTRAGSDGRWSLVLPPEVRGDILVSAERGGVSASTVVEVAAAADVLLFLESVAPPPPGDEEVETGIPVLGRVQDIHGIPLADTRVTGGGAETVSGPEGRFTLVPTADPGDTIEVTARLPMGDGSHFPSPPVHVVLAGEAVEGVVLVVEAVQEASLTLSGQVMDPAGTPLDAEVTAGESRVRAVGGRFTLSGVTGVLGETIILTGSHTRADGGVLVGTLSVRPTTQAVADLVLVVGQEDATEPAPADTVDLVLPNLAFDGALALEFARSDSVLSILDRLRARMSAPDPCADPETGALRQRLRGGLDRLDSALVRVEDTHAGLRSALQAAGAEERSAESRYLRSMDRYRLIRSLADGLAARFDSLGCPEPGTASGPPKDAPERCGDGLDNDGDGRVDECEDGCCRGLTVVEVREAGSYADDSFAVELDTGQTARSTPQSAARLEAELEAGSHWVRVRALESRRGPATFAVRVTVDGALALQITDALPPGGERLYIFTVERQPGPPPAPLIRLAPAETMQEP